MHQIKTNWQRILVSIQGSHQNIRRRGLINLVGRTVNPTLHDVPYTAQLLFTRDKRCIITNKTLSMNNLILGLLIFPIINLIYSSLDSSS